MADKKLEVKDLRISFRTANGKVQAVRDISFDLYKGETIAIVGESGSGKSVTSRAIMGILAGNAIVDGGKILYNGQDLLKINEEEFHRIRGDKIAMVFQDPLSSLNPIMRIGKQLTEAMLLKNKASRRESKAAMNEMFEALSKRMSEAGVTTGAANLEKFKKFELKHCELESQYTEALAAANEGAALSADLVLQLKNNAVKELPEDVKELVHCAEGSCNHFVVRAKASELKQLASELKNTYKTESGSYPKTIAILEKMNAIFAEAAGYDVPNTFTLGYYLTFVDSNIPEMSVAELNQLTHKRTTDDFMAGFMAEAENAVRYSAAQTDKARQKAIDALNAKLPLFCGNPEKKAVEEAIKELIPMVKACLDPLEVAKDNLTHTFHSSIEYASDLYFGGAARNEKEQKRYAKEKAKHEAIIAKGKTPDWEVIPMSLVDLDRARQELEDTVREQIAHFQAQIEADKVADYAERTLQIIDYLKEMAQNSVYNVTKAVAKERAIKLMESVGIDNPRRRFKQYPFEFSGGMRQRIVIAIALTANPDVLICDEPTTALDVTIQAQILELINNLKKERNLSVIFITHDLGVVANMADRIAVMYAGKIVEYGTAEDIFYDPAHPYTWALLSSVPDLNTKEKLESIPGTPPNMIYPPKGDAFADRNKYALQIDFEEQPPMFQISESHYAATWLRHPDAPKVDPPKIVVERINRLKKGKGENA